jgi:hypothetical protein
MEGGGSGQTATSGQPHRSLVTSGPFRGTVPLCSHVCLQLPAYLHGVFLGGGAAAVTCAA